MPVILSDETWARISGMLLDYESGALRTIPGTGLKYLEQVSGKSNCPGTKLGVDVQELINTSFGFGTLNLNVCVNGTPESHIFLTKL